MEQLEITKGAQMSIKSSTIQDTASFQEKLPETITDEILKKYKVLNDKCEEVLNKINSRKKQKQ